MAVQHRLDVPPADSNKTNDALDGIVSLLLLVVHSQQQYNLKYTFYLMFLQIHRILLAGRVYAFQVKQ